MLLAELRKDIDERFWVREGGFSTGVFDFRPVECWRGPIVASEPFADSVRLAERLGNLPSSDIFDFGDFGLAVRVGVSLPSFGDFDLDGVSGRAVLLDLPSSFLDRKLDDDLGESALIRILAFPSFDFSPVPLSSRSPTGVPFREDGWPSLVNGGLGGTWWLSVRLWPLPFAPSFWSVTSVGSGVGILGLPTASLLWALENPGYGRLTLDSRNEAVAGRLALSTPGMEDLRLRELRVEALEVEVEEWFWFAGISRDRSLVEERLGRTWDER